MNLLSPGRLGAHPIKKRWEGGKEAMVSGQGQLCHPIVSLLPCSYYISHQPSSYSLNHLRLPHHSSLRTGLHIRSPSSILTPPTLNTIPTVPVKNHFPHPQVTTTPARPLAIFFIFFFFYELLSAWLLPPPLCKQRQVAAGTLPNA